MCVIEQTPSTDRKEHYKRKTIEHICILIQEINILHIRKIYYKLEYIYI